MCYIIRDRQNVLKSAVSTTQSTVTDQTAKTALFLISFYNVKAVKHLIINIYILKLFIVSFKRYNMTVVTVIK